jgi:hypothetical protein
MTLASLWLVYSLAGRLAMLMMTNPEYKVKNGYKLPKNGALPLLSTNKNARKFSRLWFEISNLNSHNSEYNRIPVKFTRKMEL